jgi:hypothetical protein
VGSHPIKFPVIGTADTALPGFLLRGREEDRSRRPPWGRKGEGGGGRYR